MDANSAPKRARYSSPDTSGDASSAKLSRLPPPNTGHKLICTLPPTCSPPNHPSYLQSSADLERHYALYHAHVCEVKDCGCVFPEARFLELHQTECHDSLAQIKQERGEKIFACFLSKSACSKLFSTPKARRLHLINAHGYPNQYFFAVTNKGIGGLLKRWGEGASMLRGEWTPRPLASGSEIQADDQTEAVKDGGDSTTKMQREAPTRQPPVRETEGTMATFENDNLGGDYQMEDLETSLRSLALVPDKVRFGRGGKQRGFVRGSRGMRGERGGRQAQQVTSAEATSLGEGRDRREGAPRQNLGNRKTNNDNTEANFQVVNSRGRGRGRLYVPSG